MTPGASAETLLEKKSLIEPNNPDIEPEIKDPEPLKLKMELTLFISSHQPSPSSSHPEKGGESAQLMEESEI
jgi:hypothetical protein